MSPAKPVSVTLTTPATPGDCFEGWAHVIESLEHGTDGREAGVVGRPIRRPKSPESVNSSPRLRLRSASARTVLVLGQLGKHGACRFTHLRKGLAGVSEKMLTQTRRASNATAWSTGRFTRPCRSAWSTS
jgi:hypothetical protein